MVPAKEIIAYVDEIARQYEPTRVVLFGSHAYGDPSPDSDVDILVVMPYRGASHHQATRIRLSASPATFPMDLIVRSEGELSRRIKHNDSFAKEVVERGLVLYDVNDSRMGVQGRRRLRRRNAAAAVPVSARVMIPSASTANSA